MASSCPERPIGETGIVLDARAGPGLSAKNLSVSKRLHTSTPLGSIQFIVSVRGRPLCPKPCGQGLSSLFSWILQRAFL